MTITLSDLEKRFEEINKMKESVRTKRLANLMSDMEIMYGIPAFNYKSFEKNNPKIMALYRKVSAARKF